MLSPGNHEAPCDYAEYEARAALMPHWSSRSSDMQYYSYNVGNVHVVSLSGEAGRFGSVNSTEVQWLEADLAAADAARRRGDIAWIITHVHYPNVPTGYCSSHMTYCCANGRQGLRQRLEGLQRSQALPSFGANNAAPSCVDGFMTPVNKYVEDLFVQYHVDVHITAHQHVYERTTPVYRYTAFGNGTEPFPRGNPGRLFVKPAYPINVNNGCPGNVELQDVWMPRPSWSVGGRFNADGSGGTTPTSWQDFGVLRMEFDGNTSLTVDYVSDNGTTLDTFTIQR